MSTDKYIQPEEAARHKTFSFDVLGNYALHVDLSDEELHDSRYITLFWETKEWLVFTEGTWHRIPHGSLTFLKKDYAFEKEYSCSF